MVASVVAGVAALALILTAVIWLSGAFGEPQKSGAESAPGKAQAGPGIKVDLASLTRSDTHAKIGGAPADAAPMKATDGAIVHPRRVTAVRAAPNGKPIAKIGPHQLGDTWLPVIEKRPGWVRVLLPSKPNGSTGWLRDVGLKKAVTRYAIRVHLASKTMELFFKDREVGSWTIGIGKPKTPTPVGRTFLLGSFVDRGQSYSPVILPLGAHSATLDSFGGGPGTVAIHTWPNADVFGTAISNGCIRVPQDALKRLTEVPLGTLVLVDQK